MTPNIGKLYIVRKYFSSPLWIWDRYLKIKLWLGSMCKVSDYTKIHVKDQGTFVEKRGHHLEGDITLNHLAQRMGGGSGRWMVAWCLEVATKLHVPPSRHRCIWAVGEFALYFLAPLNLVTSSACPLLLAWELSTIKVEVRRE